MPWGCGVWPAYWLLGPDWPSHGEIDIIEGVNTARFNAISMHTSDNCTLEGSEQSAYLQTTNCYHAANGNSGCGSLLTSPAPPNNYGEDLNNNGGGVYATEWTSNYVKHWFFPRYAIPTSITDGAPNPSQFGLPAVNQQGRCSIDDHFGNMSIIINTDFCGAWAGNVYSQFPNCPQTPGASSLDSCVDFVGNNPSYFADAYWSINSIRVYQMPPGARPSSTYSTSLSSVAPLASTNTINKGMGASTTALSSAPYTGPLSSDSSKTSSRSTSSAAATSTTASASEPSSVGPQCPRSNGTLYSDPNGVDFMGPPQAKVWKLRCSRH
ncbi:hypothetical protein LTR37_004676 [Vermiconidia calcicola]|uniref:Uncharacterized protein n=1 Tax=Vermiconidia calcicola TaxID=1690605 RepID=A0ACC3NMK2_9PEZI|nr:hypothetical protein LTR37_004676 [Vermiconidia calcicola]